MSRVVPQDNARNATAGQTAIGQISTGQSSLNHPVPERRDGGVVVLFPGGHGKPQLRPFPYPTHRGQASVGTLVGEQQHHAARGRHPAAGARVARRRQVSAPIGPEAAAEPSAPRTHPEFGSMTEFSHRPVMLDEVLETFEVLPPGIVIDATLGGAGHASAVLAQDPERILLGIDQDPTALEAASERLAADAHRVRLVRARFDELPAILDRRDGDPLLAGKPVVGALFDLGVSSPQLDVAARGFSHRFDAPLDMRMDPDAPVSAASIVNEYSADELRSMLRRLADEPHARRIAEAIVANRPLSTTTELVDIVKAAVPAAARRSGRHPAMRTFQAIRIEVNRELDVLEPALTGVIERLTAGGRLAVISYHSGEDRIVKHVLRRAADGACDCPSGLPCICGAGPSVRLIRRKVRRPAEAEVAANPRAASARFRAAERLAVGEA